METILSFGEYLQAHAVGEIGLGQSGAKVYRLTGNRIAKHVQRRLLQSDEVWARYRREALFYGCYSGATHSFLPQIDYHELREDELLLIMQAYQPVHQAQLSQPDMLDLALEALAQIHSLPVPEFLSAGEATPFHLAPDVLEHCRQGWLGVLREHPGCFSEADLQTVAENINPVNARLFAPRLALNHGDFHCENLLTDDLGRIIVCDWQNCGVGDVTGDISFLLSRLSADGYPQDAAQTLEAYCRHASIPDPAPLDSQMRLANLNTTFLFWHEYLHGSPEDRVRQLFIPMVDDLLTVLAR